MVAAKVSEGTIRTYASVMGTSKLPEAVAGVILSQYHSLPKTGKPQPNEHTVLAGFAISLDDEPHAASRGAATQPEHAGLVPVALGTGTKCVGSRQSRHQIDVINDSHAEVGVASGTWPLLHRRPAAKSPWQLCPGHMLSKVAPCMGTLN